MLITEIKSNPNNPRLIKDHKFKQLVKSIQDFPQMLELRPIVIDENNMVLGGNMRLKACLEAGMTDVPVIHANNLSEEKKKEFIVKDNVGYGEWDWDDLANNWDALELTEWGLDIPNFEGEVLEAEEDDFAVPEGGTETDIVLGDLFEIGEHRLLCGDSGIVENLDKLMNGNKVDLIFTDPPYGMKYKPNHSKKREGNYNGAGYHNVKEQEMIIGDDEDYDPSFLMEYFKYCKEQFWWGADYYAEKIPNRQKGNFQVWNKRYGIEDIDFNTSHFEIVWSKQSHLKEIVNIKWFGIQGTEKQDVRNRIHPTQKPIQLPSWYLDNYGKGVVIVADFYLGSGTTMVSSHQHKRKCYGMELDPKYCQVIVDRMRKLDPTLEIKKNGVTLP